MWEIAINVRPVNRIGTGCQCRGTTFASTTIATPGLAQATEMLRVRSVIRGFMAALSLSTSNRIERGQRHGTGKIRHQLGRPERRRLHPDDGRIHREHVFGFSINSVFDLTTGRSVDVIGSTLSVVRSLVRNEASGPYDNRTCSRTVALLCCALTRRGGLS